MKKKVWLILVCLLLAVYVLFSGKLYRSASRNQCVSDTFIEVADSLNHPFVRPAEIRQLLLANGLDCVGKRVDSVDLAKIEQCVLRHPMVGQAEASLIPSGQLRINVRQRIPVMRLLTPEGRYFLDTEGQLMRIPFTRGQMHAVDVPVATGHIHSTDSLLLDKLFEFSSLLNKNPFWDHMIEQIEVGADGYWRLYPRVGQFDIVLGPPEDLEFKLDALRSFYVTALPKVGWNAFREVSLEFDHQIVCTKMK